MTTGITASATKRRWFQFRPRSLLLLVVLASVGSCTVMRVRNGIRLREASEPFDLLGGRVFWAYRTTDEPFLWTFLTLDFEAKLVQLGGTQATDADLAHLQQRTIRETRRLCLQGTKVTDAGLVHLKCLSLLQELDVSYTKVTGAGLENSQRAEVPRTFAS